MGAERDTQRILVQRWLGRLLLSLGIILATEACSSSKTQEEDPNATTTEETASNAPPPDAGTDAVPAGSIENPPPANPEAAPAQAEAPPPAEPPAAPAEQAANPPPAPPTLSGEYVEYTVRAGDTLMKIAFEQLGDLYQWKRLHSDNSDKIQDSGRIEVGTVIRVPKPATPVAIERNGEAMRILSGDTLGKISQRVYRTSAKWRRLWENNRQLIRDPNKIYAGFFLYYSMTPEDQEEIRRLEQEPTTTAPAPLAGTPEPAAPVAGAAPVEGQAADANRAPAASSDSSGAPPADPANSAPAAPSSN